MKATTDYIHSVITSLDAERFIPVTDIKRKSDHIYQHSIEVSGIAMAIGYELKLNATQLEQLALCALYHDIGMTTVSPEIVNKNTLLHRDEFDQIKTHPIVGEELLQNNPVYSNDIRLGIFHHHERYDGFGYPHGLRSEEIPLFSRILAVADVYAALVANRPHRKAVSRTTAIEYITLEMGRGFDAEIAKTFLAIHNVNVPPCLPEVVKWNLFTINMLNSSVYYNKTNLMLTKHEYALLVLFIKNFENHIPAHLLYEKAWNAPMDSNTTSLRGAIKRLRAKMDGCGWLINYVRGEGYIFERE